MPATHYSEAALARRQEKLDAARAFPGRIPAALAVGKTVAEVAGTVEEPVLVFTDGSFLLLRAHEPQGSALYDTLLGAREALAARHPAALDVLERCAEAEAEAMRLARMEKILGAVETNLPAVPELRQALFDLLDEG